MKKNQAPVDSKTVRDCGSHSEDLNRDALTFCRASGCYLNQILMKILKIIDTFTKRSIHICHIYNLTDNFLLFSVISPPPSPTDKITIHHHPPPP